MRKNSITQPDVCAVIARARQPIPVSGSYDLSSSLESDKLWSWLLDFILASLLLHRSAPRVKAGRCACAPEPQLCRLRLAPLQSMSRRSADMQPEPRRTRGATRRRGESPNQTLLSVRPPTAAAGRLSKVNSSRLAPARTPKSQTRAVRPI